MNCLGSHRSNKHCCFSSLSSFFFFFFLLLSGSGLSNFHVRVKDSCGCSWLVFHHRFQAHALQRETHGGQRVLLYKLISSPPKLLLVSTDCSVSYTRWFRHASNIGQEIVRKSCMRFVVVSVLFQMKLNDNQSRQSGLNSMMLQGQIQLGQYSFTFVSTFFFFTVEVKIYITVGIHTRDFISMYSTLGIQMKLHLIVAAILQMNVRLIAKEITHSHKDGELSFNPHVLFTT